MQITEKQWFVNTCYVGKLSGSPLLAFGNGNNQAMPAFGDM